MQELTAARAVLVWAIALGTIAAVISRPRRWPEAVWACAGACLLVLFGLVSIPAAVTAIAKGTDVYLFLTGMMLLAELARREGVFDWLAVHAVDAARGSAKRLSAVVYAVGILVTVFLSNDATAVVLTPAVYAAVKEARANPLPYLLVCAFIANAASFVLPISNPANLVVYGKTLPPLAPWLRTFLLPSVFSIAATYVALRWRVRKDLPEGIEGIDERIELTAKGQRAAGAIAASGAVLLASSALGFDLGLPTCAAAALAVLITTGLRFTAIRDLASRIAWSVLPLVAGLFIIVEGLNRTNAMGGAANAFRRAGELPAFAGVAAASFSIAALSNIMNNLPSGLLAGSALQAAHVLPRIRDSVLIGVDLGPNLSVTGSLATVLWLIALRREGIQIGAWQFFKVGAMVMPPALILAILGLDIRR